MNQAHLAMTRRETIQGGSTPASMRVMVIAQYPQDMSAVMGRYYRTVNSEFKKLLTSNSNLMMGFFSFLTIH